MELLQHGPGHGERPDPDPPPTHLPPLVLVALWALPLWFLSYQTMTDCKIEPSASAKTVPLVAINW